jgi:hypothetical protein
MESVQASPSGIRVLIERGKTRVRRRYALNGHREPHGRGVASLLAGAAMSSASRARGCLAGRSGLKDHSGGIAGVFAKSAAGRNFAVSPLPQRSGPNFNSGGKTEAPVRQAPDWEFSAWRAGSSAGVAVGCFGGRGLFLALAESHRQRRYSTVSDLLILNRRAASGIERDVLTLLGGGL